MGRILMSLDKYTFGGWRWTILHDFTFTTYCTDEFGAGIYIVNPSGNVKFRSPREFSIRNASFDQALRTIKSRWKDLDMAMFLHRSRPTLIRLLAIHSQLLNRPTLVPEWGNPPDAGERNDHWHYKRYGSQLSFKLGGNLAEACDYVREMIRSDIKLMFALGAMSIEP